MKYCNRCGTKIKKHTKFCHNCGYRFSKQRIKIRYIFSALSVIVIVIVIMSLFLKTETTTKPLDQHLTLPPKSGTLENKLIIEPEVEIIEELECYTSNNCNSDEQCLDNKCKKIPCLDGYIEDRICKEYDCSINDDCNYDETCVNRLCEKISCSGYVQNHICYDCYIDTDCDDDEFCDNKLCTELSCAKGESWMNHKCVQHMGFYDHAQKYMTPFDSVVTAKLDELTDGIYTNESFGINLDKIYYYATSISYRYDSEKWGVGDYWQTAAQTINDSTGDCEDQAILLQSLTEGLLYKTYGYIPEEVVYMVCGGIDSNYDGTTDGYHCWNIIDASKLPDEGFWFKLFDSKVNVTPGTMSIVLNDVTVNHTKMAEQELLYDTSMDLNKQRGGTLSIMWQGRKWVEMEPTWNMPISYYEDKTYPFTELWSAFNSQEYYEYPDFVKGGYTPTIFEDLTAYLQTFLRNLYDIIINDWF